MTVIIPEQFFVTYFNGNNEEFTKLISDYREKVVSEAEERKRIYIEEQKARRVKNDKELLRSSILRAKNTYGEEFVIDSMKEMYTIIK